jgi:hypothetical protein
MAPSEKKKVSGLSTTNNKKCNEGRRREEFVSNPERHVKEFDAAFNDSGKQLICNNLQNEYEKNAIPCGYPYTDRDGNINLRGKMFFKDGSLSVEPNEYNGSDPYYLEKVTNGVDNNKSDLRLTINADENESFQVWGNACGTGNCDGDGEEQHELRADGYSWHKKMVNTPAVNSRNYAFENTEQDGDNYPHRLINDKRTVLRWDRNNTGKADDFRGSGHPTFYYRDPDARKFRHLVDTGNMRKLDARFKEVSTPEYFFKNREQSDYPRVGTSDTSENSNKTSDTTALVWDRNNTDRADDFEGGGRATFFYKDNDDGRFKYLVDTGNMDKLKARFKSVRSPDYHFENREQGDYPQVDGDRTVLRWDRNNTNKARDFVGGDRATFFYKDNDDGRFKYLIDTGNMGKLDAKFRRVRAPDYYFLNTEKDRAYPPVTRDKTALRWDRNNTGNASRRFSGGGVHGNNPTFYYRDPDTGEFRYLIDTGNMKDMRGQVDMLDVRGDMNVNRKIYFNDHSFGGNWGVQNTDPYYLEKIEHGQNDSELRMTINDDAKERFTIFGNACRTTGCQGAGVKQHQFQGDGNAWHRGGVKADQFKSNVFRFRDKNNNQADKSSLEYNRNGGVNLYTDDSFDILESDRDSRSFRFSANGNKFCIGRNCLTEQDLRNMKAKVKANRNRKGLPFSKDDRCGPETGKRCPGGKCCSIYGWCGRSPAYCDGWSRAAEKYQGPHAPKR